jgi:RNA polymerase sigma factor (sigma-70 family)
MAFGKKHDTTAAATQAVSEWSVAELSALYSENRSSFVAQARRILRSDADANEIVQEAFLKFILAAPELDTPERAMAYLRTTVNNLCLNQIRATGARPNLVAIDAETTQERLAEISAEAHISIDDTLAAAEDASIIREALSRLTPDQRTALVMWEMEGRSTEEIAAALGTKPENVRHVVSRARQSFVRVLSTWVIDEETGTTALDALSTSYKKAAEIAKKSSKVALSLIVLLVAFLGFNSLTGREAVKTITTASSSQTQSAPAAPASKAPAAPQPAAPAPDKSDKKVSSLQSDENAKATPLSFYGLNTQGIPSGFTVTDGAGHDGVINVSKSDPTITNDGLVLHSTAMTNDNNAANVLLDQNIVVGGSGTSYNATPSVTINHSWTGLNVTATSTDFSRLPDGNYLLTATMIVDSTIDSDTLIPVHTGVDVSSAPAQITTRIVLNPGKTQILAQAISIATKGAE